VSSEEVPALVFGPGLPPGGARGSLAVSPLGVEVAAGGRSHRADLASVSLRAAGFGKPGLEIAWRDEEGAWAAHVLDHSTAQRLLELPPLANSAQGELFRAQQRRGSVKRSIGWSALAAYLLLPVVLLLLVVLNAGTLAGWMAEQIPAEQETRLGRQAFEGMKSSLDLRDEGPAYDAATSIVARLTQGSRYQYEVHVSRDETLNAFALPGGILVVNSGLIAATRRPEELAGVLAHEVQHVELRHSIRGLIKELGLRGLWVMATGDFGGTLAGQAALELTSLKFSRDDESEADSLAFDALLRAGIDPAGMPAFFETMSKESADAPVALLSTHPLSEERKRVLEQRVTELGRKDFEPLSFGTWPPR
jgi:Zn-dependent protease with chaperone function